MKNESQLQANWGIFTIKTALDAKHHVEMYGSRWRGETWSKWFKFLPSIGVYYDKKDRTYKDIKK